MMSRQLLILGVCLLCATAAAGAEPVQRLTFIEVRGDAADRARTLLEQYASRDSSRSARAHVLVLEEIARPERFVLLEEAPRAEDLTQPAPSSELNALLTAPPDRRTHRKFGDGAAPPGSAAAESRAPAPALPGPSATSPAPPSASPPVPSASPPVPSTSPRAAARPSTAVYVVAHLDMAPPERAKGEAALQRIIEQARKSTGNLRFDVWQQSDRPNHFNLIAVWTSRAKFNDFAAGPAARDFRKSVASLLGSPYDERLYHRVKKHE